MPFVGLDEHGVCTDCRNYVPITTHGRAAFEEVAPSFAHYPAASLPQQEEAGVRLGPDDIEPAVPNAVVHLEGWVDFVFVATVEPCETSRW